MKAMVWCDDELYVCTDELYVCTDLAWRVRHSALMFCCFLGDFVAGLLIGLPDFVFYVSLLVCMNASLVNHPPTTAWHSIKATFLTQMSWVATGFSRFRGFIHLASFANAVSNFALFSLVSMQVMPSSDFPRVRITWTRFEQHLRQELEALVLDVCSTHTRLSYLVFPALHTSIVPPNSTTVLVVVQRTSSRVYSVGLILWAACDSFPWEIEYVAVRVLLELFCNFSIQRTLHWTFG